MHGILYMLPVPIAEGATGTIPPEVVYQMHRIGVFVMERGKTGRQHLKACTPEINLQGKVFIEMGEPPHQTAVQETMSYLRRGQDVALMSESGCPGVADPGALFAEAAHTEGFRVVPLVGPSSILLALMASGMQGQQFAFIGYLTNKKEELSRDIQRMEDRSRQLNQTQIFIETPYRNQSLLEALVRQLNPRTRLCVAYDLTGTDEQIISKPVQAWKKSPVPQLSKKPCIFLVWASQVIV